MSRYKDPNVLSKKDQRAIEKRDGIAYKRFCDTHGIPPTLTDLYDTGQADLLCNIEDARQRKSAAIQKRMRRRREQEYYVSMIEGPSKSPKKRASAKISAATATRYRLFLEEARQIPAGSYESNAGPKEDILRKYFGRFCADGSQPLERYRGREKAIGSIFDRMVRRAEDVRARYESQS